MLITFSRYFLNTILSRFGLVLLMGHGSDAAEWTSVFESTSGIDHMERSIDYQALFVDCLG